MKQVIPMKLFRCTTQSIDRFIYILSLLTVSLIAFQASAAESFNTLEKGRFFSYKPSGIAIRGADTVAYFTEGKYVPGADEYTTQWPEGSGVTWKFASQDHLNLFTSDPGRYAPQYGGYCAYGVSQDYLVKIEPENWRIIDDKLYLNFNDSVQQKWEKDIPGYINQANANFQPLLEADK